MMKKLKLFDAVVIAVIILITVGMNIYGSTAMVRGSTAVLVCDGKEAFYDLSEPKKIPVESNGVSLTLVIEDGYVYVEESDCPNGACVNMGKICDVGQTVVCAPAKLYVKIVGEGAEDYDVSIG